MRATLALLLLLLLGHAQSLSTLNLAASLSTNSTTNCDMGLTHSGVFLLVEYRLTGMESVNEPVIWRPLGSIRLNYTDTGLFLLLAN